MGKLGYYTHYQEPSLGLMQLGVRFYESEIGRFTQRDPIRHMGGVNQYGYAYDNPVSMTDPTGLKPTCKERCDEVVAKLRAANNLTTGGASAFCIVLGTAVGCLGTPVAGIVVGGLCELLVGGLHWYADYLTTKYEWECKQQCDENPCWEGPKL